MLTTQERVKLLLALLNSTEHRLVGPTLEQSSEMVSTFSANERERIKSELMALAIATPAYTTSISDSGGSTVQWHPRAESIITDPYRAARENVIVSDDVLSTTLTTGSHNLDNPF